MLARRVSAPLHSHRTPGGGNMSADDDLLIDGILDGQAAIYNPLVDEIVNLDDDSVRSVEKPIGVDSHSYRRRAAKRAYENLLFQRPQKSKSAECRTKARRSTWLSAPLTARSILFPLGLP